MNIVKKISYAISVAAVSAPFVVSAAFDPTAGGSTGLPGGSIIQIITNLMNWLLYAIGIIGVIGFIIAGILYLTAAGDEGQIDKAKTAMVYSIVGVIVALLGVVILTAAKSFLGGTGSNF